MISLTANQIAYAKYQQEKIRDSETKRTNLANEAISGRQADASTRQAVAAEVNANTNRLDLANKRTQAQAAQTSALGALLRGQASLASATEAARHNVASEAEATRHNQAAERIQQLTSFNSTAAQRAIASANLAEQRRTNRANETIRQTDADTRKQVADQGERQLSINQQQADAASARARNDTVRTVSGVAETVLNTIGGIVNGKAQASGPSSGGQAPYWTEMF